MTRVIGYVRVSTEEQATVGVSIDAQIAKIKGYSALYDLELVDIIVDAGQSAKTLNREGLQQALKLLDGGQADALIVVKLDRLTRSVKDLGVLLDNYFGDRFSLMSVSEQVDTRTAGGRLVLNVLMSVAQWEREAISERTKTALTHKKEQGEHCGGVGFGYKVINKKLAKTEQYKVVKTIEELRNQGLTLQQIADRLNSENVATARGGKWYPTTVKNLVDRELRLKA